MLRYVFVSTLLAEVVDLFFNIKNAREGKMCSFCVGEMLLEIYRNIGIDVTVHIRGKYEIALLNHERDALLEETKLRLRNRELEVSCLLRSSWKIFLWKLFFELSCRALFVHRSIKILPHFLQEFI